MRCFYIEGEVIQDKYFYVGKWEKGDQDKGKSGTAGNRPCGDIDKGKQCPKG